jgi:acyl-coenzyme A thioesterase PaaI-like protein
VYVSPPLDRAVADAVSITVLDPAAGRVSMPIEEYVHNSFGAVQGGVMALIGEVAGAEAIGASLGLGGPATAVDLHVTYLAQGRVGPIATRVRSITSGAGLGTVVELVDEGAGHRLNTVVSVGAVAP